MERVLEEINMPEESRILIFLIKKILQDRKVLVLSFQSNIYAIIIA